MNLEFPDLVTNRPKETMTIDRGGYLAAVFWLQKYQEEHWAMDHALKSLLDARKVQKESKPPS